MPSIKAYRAAAHEMEPVEEAHLGRRQRAARRGVSIATFALLDLNDWAIGKTADTSPVWDTHRWPWIADVERATPTIRRELDAYLDRASFPHVAAMSGLDPDSEEGKISVPGIKGTWRTLLLFANGQWIDETARHFPETVACFRHIHPKANLGFSALEPRSHIETHVGPNRGALRFQLPVIVPGEYGDCRIRVGDRMLKWVEGEALMFDLSTNHEAWNDTDALRVLLMVEIEMPLPRPQSWLNRLAQYSYRWHPSFRQMVPRVEEIGRAQEALAGGAGPG